MSGPTTIDNPYRLTPQQLAEGWTVEQTWHENGREWLRRHYKNGHEHDPGPGMPAVQCWREDGQEQFRFYYQSNRPQDPEPGVPAMRHWHKNGREQYRSHYQGGQQQDPSPGTPAVQHWYESGQEQERCYYQNGQMQDPAPGMPAIQQWHESGERGIWTHWHRDVYVPSDFHRWQLSDALAAKNAEDRGMWFEINGWDKIEDRLTLLDTQHDPANDGHYIRLYAFPAEFDPYGGQGRVIICDNASLDLDGSRRTYAIPVPTNWGSDALTVMARSYGLTRDEYAQLSIAK